MRITNSNNSNVTPLAPADGDTLVGTGGQGTWKHRSIYGDGSDGAATDSGPIQLLRSYNHMDWTWTGACAIDAHGCVSAANGTLDIVTAPALAYTAYAGGNGNSAAVNVAGAATSVPSGTIGGGALGSQGPAGAAGATTTGTSSAVVGNGNPYYGGREGPVGAAGTGSAGANAAGAFGATTSIFGVQDTPRNAEFFTVAGGQWPPGAPSGGGDGTASASGAGGGAPIPGMSGAVYARILNRSASNANAGVINCPGKKSGDGGTPAAGNRGGGGSPPGSGAGVFRLVCEALTGTVHVNCIDVTGGQAGVAGNKTGTGVAGVGSGGGYGGQSLINVGGVCTVTDKRSVGGNVGSGMTGGISTTAQCNL